MASHNEISERNWELLLEAINNKRVVPIIGDDFFYIIEDEKEISVKEFLIKKLALRFNVTDSFIDFSSIADAIELENFMNHKIRFINSQTDIYYEINQILQSEKIHVRESLHQLIELNKFPLILTTSFIPGLETLLSQKGHDCVSLSYERAADSDLTPAVLCGNKTIIYYLFGRCGIAEVISLSYLSDRTSSRLSNQTFAPRFLSISANLLLHQTKRNLY